MTGITLKPFQQAAVTNTLAAFDRGVPSCLVVHPTGTGKTYVFSAVAEAMKPKRTLVLAHRGFLLEQAGNTLEKFDLGATVEKAKQYANPHDLMGSCVLASVQSLKGDRLARFPRDTFGLVVVDEAHHALAPSYRRVLDRFSTAKLLGVTATPERGDGEKLGEVFAELAHEYKLKDAIEQKQLVPLTIEIDPKVQIDLSKIRTTAGDLNQGDLEDEISKHIEELVNATKERIGDRCTIVFTPDVGSAQAFADGLRQIGVTARSVHGKSEDKDTVLGQFKAGDFQVLCNCMIATEGFDCVDEETEILTDRGWSRRNQVSTQDHAYSLNRQTGRIELTPVLRVVARPVNDGERMVTIKSQHVDIRATEGHEFHIKCRNPRKPGGLSDDYITLTGTQLANRRSAYALPLAAAYEQGFPGVRLTDDELRFIAWFMTDGGFETNYACISQSKDYHREIRDLIQRLGFSYTERVRRSATAYPNARPVHEFRIPKGTHCGTLARKGWFPYAEYLDKDVSRALHLMDRRQFQTFWAELLKGNGSNYSDNKSGWLWCPRKSQADAYTEMAVLRGLAASYAPEITQNGTEVYRVSVRDAQWITSDPSDSRSARINLEAAKPDEMVWCIENRNSTLIARRHGKIAIIGNCPRVSAIVMARPTKSGVLYRQMIGRGTRLCHGKPNCIAEGHCVLTDRGLVPIERVTLDMKVWDGCEFVSHGGAVCQGEQEVIEYAGIEATPDHRVWTQHGWRTFDECRQNKDPIAVTGFGGTPIRETARCFRGDFTGSERKGAAPDRVRLVQQAITTGLQQCTGVKGRLPEVRESDSRPDVAIQEGPGGASPVLESPMRSLCSLRREGDSIPVHWPSGNGPLGARASRLASRLGNRPDRQRRELRAREPAIPHPTPADVEHSHATEHCEDARVSPAASGDPLRGLHPGTHAWSRNDGHRDRGAVSPLLVQAKRRVWDILNAGPRHRFTVEGLLVSNCLVVDFAWNSGQHDLVSPVELFDTAGMDADVLEIADELVKTGKEKDPLRAIAEAEAIHRKKLALRMTVRERQSRYHMVAFDPFEVGTILGVSRRKHTTNAVPVTLEQQLRLDNLFKTYTIDYDGVTRAYARNLLTEIDTRRQEGLCTHRQLATLIANGVDQDEARAMAFDEASSRIGELVGKR